MLRKYSHTKSERLAQIRTTMAEIQHFFLGDCFFCWHTLHIKRIKHVNKQEQQG